MVRRSDVEFKPGEASELDATLDDDGSITFEFRNQPWVELIGWLSDLSGQPIDWTELPADSVNLKSPGRLSVSPTRNLFN